MGRKPLRRDSKESNRRHKERNYDEELKAMQIGASAQTRSENCHALCERSK